MKKIFTSAPYTAKYNESNEMWDVYCDNVKVAAIYDDSREVRFTNTDMNHHISELTALRELIAMISAQYENLNNR